MGTGKERDIILFFSGGNVRGEVPSESRRVDLFVYHPRRGHTEIRLVKIIVGSLHFDVKYSMKNHHV